MAEWQFRRQRVVLETIRCDMLTLARSK